MLDILAQKRKDTEAAGRFFRKLLKGQGHLPLDITTDKLDSYGAAKRKVMPWVPHCQDRYANNRSEVSMNTPVDVNGKCVDSVAMAKRNDF